MKKLTIICKKEKWEKRYKLIIVLIEIKLFKRILMKIIK